ncbi:nucleoside recognition domain protein [Ammonifex degensii KC4]|uniref:Nucleoside recognition domain protein n=1 Tax=Ammonifex degensii (strain DSM 10501 / KC4) TaxID=429009 RepID=C9RAK9_AMMDK|nr:nucleoside recognition domain-containing protein [Ammonifex degensii]ACX51286.1 nucleoside recognition domain protein [Ammonifex degensii KC4]
MKKTMDGRKVFCRGLCKGAITTWKLVKVTVPIYVTVTLLKHTPFLSWLASLCSPLMHNFGLPGEAALALVMGNVLNIYAAVGVIASLSLSAREVTILGIMLLLSHNLPTESAISAQIGVNPLLMGSFRLATALGVGLLLNLVL